MEFLKLIIFISSVIGAISAIFLFLNKIYKIIRNIENKFDNIEKAQKITNLSTLRLVITNESMPLEERVAAGAEYVKLGGNGKIHALYDVLCKIYKEELERKEVN